LEKRLNETFQWEKYEVWGAAMNDLKTFLQNWIPKLLEALNQPLFDLGRNMAQKIADGIIANASVIGKAISDACNGQMGEQSSDTGSGNNQSPPTPVEPDPTRGRGMSTMGNDIVPEYKVNTQSNVPVADAFSSAEFVDAVNKTLTIPATLSPGTTSINNSTSTANIYINGINVSDAPDSVKSWLVEVAQRKNVNNRGKSFNNK